MTTDKASDGTPEGDDADSMQRKADEAAEEFIRRQQKSIDDIDLQLRELQHRREELEALLKKHRGAS
ncbi:MAG: hypothetical protein ACLQPH_11625 [Acidimicrobiales bacterium]